ncbi:MAG TPA: gamma-glutamyltransferase family protein [Trebonia sp.]|nr:gamma-glutamyltransferase family protein [Trebonia sp.]
MADIPEFTTRPELAGTFGMVASTHWLASAAGMAVLEKGGNAFDAAAAAGFVLQVVEPHLCGPGGEVPVIGYDARRGETFVVCGQGTAPAAATLQAYLDLGLDLVPGSGLLAACVPGAFGAWLLLLREYGRLPLRDVLGYAIGYAESGYPLVPAISWGIASVAGLFREHWTTSAEVYLPGGGVPAPGSRFANPALAATYIRILYEAEAASADRDEQLEAARRAWYDGFVAEAIGRFAATDVMDVTGERHRGFLTEQDLGSWHARLEAPVTCDYQGLTVCKTGPWGQGPVFLQQLALLSGYDLAAMAPGSAEYIHTVTECAKLAFADREAWYGDPDFTDVPLDELLSSGYNDERRKLVGETASLDLRPGRPGGREPELPEFATISFGMPAREGGGRSSADRRRGSGDPGVDPATGEPLGRSGHAQARRGDTCHVDVADRWGNMVTATPSGGWLQSSPVIPDLGFCLGTRAQMFSLTPGLPATIAPRKRPRTTLTPTLALRGGEPYVAFGTPGGDQQDQWTLGFFLNHVHFGMNLQQAIDFPAFHSRHMPSSFYPREAYPGELDAESRVGEPVIGQLRERGHLVHVQPPWSLGRISAVSRHSGMLYAAANPRGMQGYAVGR